MNKKELHKILSKKILILDGAMGTAIMQRKLTSSCMDYLNITNPKNIIEIQAEYANAGSDIIITNTFGANRIKLKEYGFENKVNEINKTAVNIARKAAPNCIIAGGLGPLGKYMEPLDKLSFDEAYNAYSEQIKALSEADIIIVETLSDIKILKAALIAANDNTDKAIICSMSFQDGRSATGTDVETYVNIAESLGAAIICANCSEGPEGLLNVIKNFKQYTNLPIAVEPNAGLPKIIDGKTVFEQTPEEFGSFAEKFYKLGINIMGGCCGTTPNHIKAISEKIKGKVPIKINIESKSKLSSRLKTITIDNNKTYIVGERINPTGKKEFQNELRNNKTNYIRNQALEQSELGATLLDINVGLPEIDETIILPKAVDVIQSIVDTPIVLDSSNPIALENALKKSDGKPIINSVNGGDKSLNEILPLAKKYGAAVIALCLDETGLPKTTKQRISIAKKIIDKATNEGISKNDIYVDVLTLSIATNPDNEKIILDSVKEITKMGYKTILGVSNISHGLPNRSEINAKFLTKAKKAGLSLAILNPTDNKSMQNTEIETFKIKKMNVNDYKNLPIDKKLYNAILFGDYDNIESIIKEAINEHNFEPLKINDILIDSLNDVGDKFNKKEYFLPQVLASAKAMKSAFQLLKSKLKKDKSSSRGKILIATVENDIHDIGKNIVVALLESHNYEIIDLGTSIPKEKIIEEAKKQKPDLIGLSALMTTTAIEMESVIKELRKNNINVPVIIGGAVITEEYSEKIRAKYSKDALSAVKKINELIKKSNIK